MFEAVGSSIPSARVWKNDGKSDCEETNIGGKTGVSRVLW
jgi:hypothetical protein